MNTKTYNCDAAPFLCISVTGGHHELLKGGKASDNWASFSATVCQTWQTACRGSAYCSEGVTARALPGKGEVAVACRTVRGTAGWACSLLLVAEAPVRRYVSGNKGSSKRLKVTGPRLLCFHVCHWCKVARPVVACVQVN